MKATKKIFVIAIVSLFLVSLSSCKAGCGCPKFSMEQPTEILK